MANEPTIYIGDSVTGDFQENTWTFEMKSDWKLEAGEFVIIPKEQFDKMVIDQRLDPSQAVKDSD